MTMRTFLNCSSRIDKAEMRPADCTSFGPNSSSRLAASATVRPFGEEFKRLKVSSTVNVCQLEAGSDSRFVAGKVSPNFIIFAPPQLSQRALLQQSTAHVPPPLKKRCLSEGVESHAGPSCQRRSHRRPIRWLL